MRIVAAVMPVLAACAPDASLHVTVQHDPSYVSLVVRTEVSIYVSPDITCDAIELGDATDDQLLGARVAFADEGQPLEGIPRVDPKLIVGRGYAADGSLVTAGCVTFGEVNGDQTVIVPTVTTATVSVNQAQDSSNGLIITTIDARNDSIDGRKVSWRLYGPAGTSADPSRFKNVSDGIWEPTHPTCTLEGEATIHPMPPRLPSGYALRVRVSWAAKQPPLITAFTPIDGDVATLPGVPDPRIVKPCALQKHGGAAAIVCLTSTTGYNMYSFDVATARLSAPNAQTLPALTGDEWIAVVSVAGSGSDRDVYALSTRGLWKALNGAPPENPGTWCGGGLALLCGPGFGVSELQVVPACGTSPAMLIAKVNQGTRLRTQPFRGGAPAEYVVKDGDILNAGCVAELQPDATAKSRQVVVVSGLPTGVIGRTFTAAIFDCAATSSPCVVPLPTNGQGVAFLPGTEERLIGTTFDATGAQLAQWVMQPVHTKSGKIGSKDRLVERSRQVAAAPPRVLVTGSFDADSGLDLLWTFPSRTDIDVQIAYARPVEGAPLTALTVAPITGTLVQPTDMFTMDFNGDGFDEVVIVAQTIAGTSNSILAVRTGIPYLSQPTPTDDPACP